MDFTTNYCGPYWSDGKFQPSVDGSTPPVNALDAACQAHDAAYFHAKSDRDLDTADDKFYQTATRLGFRGKLYGNAVRHVNRFNRHMFIPLLAAAGLAAGGNFALGTHLLGEDEKKQKGTPIGSLRGTGFEMAPSGGVVYSGPTDQSVDRWAAPVTHGPKRREVVVEPDGYTQVLPTNESEGSKKAPSTKEEPKNPKPAGKKPLDVWNVAARDAQVLHNAAHLRDYLDPRQLHQPLYKPLKRKPRGPTPKKKTQKEKKRGLLSRLFQRNKIETSPMTKQ